MDKINPSNIHLSASCSLNTKFSDRSNADWSKTNLLSFVSLDGIYILKPQLDNKDGPFKISLIRNPSSQFKHPVLHQIYPKFDTIWRLLSPQQYMQVFINPALCTNIETLSLDLHPRRFRLAKWSPIISIFPKQCLLAAITTDFQLLIFKFNDDTCSGQIDLSQMFDNLWAQMQPSNGVESSRKVFKSRHQAKGGDLPNAEIDKKDFEAIRNDIHSLSFYNFCWKEMPAGDMPLLLAATISGDVVIWRVDLNAPRQNQFDVMTIIKTNLNYISSMNLLDNLLVVAVRDGQVLLYDLTPNFMTNKQARCPDTIDEVKTLNLVELQPIATLWHRDNIEVQDFYIEALGTDVYRFVLTKATNICWSIIRYQRSYDDQLATLAISDSFSAIDGLDPDVSLHQTPITWMRQAGQNRAVLVADDGSFFQLEFINASQDTIPDFHAIRTGRVDLTHLVPRALCTSPSGHLHVSISCLTLQYETAKILAPTKLLLLPTQNDWRFFVDCMNKLMDNQWLLMEQIQSPMDVCDRLDYLRAAFMELNPQQLNEISKMLKQAINDIGFPVNQVQLVKLKIVNFLLMKVSQNLGLVVGSSTSELLDKANRYINLHYIDQLLDSVFENWTETATDSRLELNSNQLISLRNYCKWIHSDYSRCSQVIVKHQERITRFITNNLEGNLDSINELCQVCQATVPFTTSKCGTCLNGHKFERCARSFIATNLKQCNEAICDHCRRHYSCSLVWPNEKHLWMCLFCH